MKPLMTKTSTSAAMPNRSLFGATLLALTVATLPGCANKSDGGALATVVLERIVFPDPSGQSSGSARMPPDNASLMQRAEFHFSGPVRAEEIGEESLQICDADGNPVRGEYVLQEGGREVVFFPAFPTGPVVDLGEGEWQVEGGGLVPGAFYDVTVPVGEPGAISNLTAVDESLWSLYDFRTKIEGGYVGRNYERGARSGLFSIRLRVTSDPTAFFTGWPTRPPLLVATEPGEGATNVTPFLYTDPKGLFAARQPFRLFFDQPLDPANDNVGEDTFKLVDIEDASGSPLDIELGVEVALAENLHDGAVVEVTPSGILPFGDRLALVYRAGLRSITGESSGEEGEVVAAVFTVAKAPPVGSGRAVDVFIEDFHTKDREDENPDGLGEGRIRAEWNENDSGYLQAAFAFPGQGELGPFLPIAMDKETHEIVLDTNLQRFPLFDGSTPEARPGTVVEGGVFNFTDIVIPKGVTVKGIGTNPLVLTATGSVQIGGTIDVSGTRGADDQTYDYGIFSVSGGLGGPGGGRGGASNPTVWDGDPVLQNQVPPRYAERGWGPGEERQDLRSWAGGGGGEGTAYPDPDWPAQCANPYCSNDGSCGPGGCGQNDEFSRGAGGGGGTMLTAGESGRPGKGNKVSLEQLDANQHPLFADNPNGNRSQGGAGGRLVFTDEDPANDFFGPRGEVQEPIGGQGGGGGGNRHDSLMCADYVLSSFPGFPAVLCDSRGGGGGGGAGAFELLALGPVDIVGQAALLAIGGEGGGGEQIGCSIWGGGGGGGSGGTIILQSARSITMKRESGWDPRFDVSGGKGNPAQRDCPDNSANCGSRNRNAEGSGGDGGNGVIQIQVPYGLLPDLGGATFAPASSLVPPERTPSEITAMSVAQTVWINTGEVIRREARPLWSFTGTDAAGRVITDEAGFVPEPDLNNFKIDALPVVDPESGDTLEDEKENYIPPGAYVVIEFQGADAVLPGSKEVDPTSIVPAPGVWSPDISIADGHQFIRYRVTFNIADSDRGYTLDPPKRRPVMRFLELPFDF
ncbi:MAG: hypothetical protein AB1486_33080 [Planctomycetota bacterium]